MDASRFDRIVRSIGTNTSRRIAARLLAGFALGGFLARGVVPAEARKKKKKKKKCRPPQTKCGKDCCTVGEICFIDGCGTSPPPPPLIGPNPGCPGPPDQSIGDGRRYAQTFVAERSGQLVTAQCDVATPGGGQFFTLQIRTLDSEGRPTTTILATDTVANAPAVPLEPNSESFTLVGNFDPPAPIEKGVGYAFVVTISEYQTFYPRSRVHNVCPGQVFDDDFADNTWDFHGDSSLVWSANIVVS